MTKIINGAASEFEFPADTGVFTQNVFEKENQELKKQLEEYKNGYFKLSEENDKYSIKLHKYKTQQKEFIKYLEDGIKQYTPSLRWKHYNEDGFNDYDVENPSCIEVQPTDKIFKEILQKYKEIIGDDK